MRSLLCCALCILCGALVACSQKPDSNIHTLSEVTAAQATKPNVLFILADDAGYADFGFMGSKDMLTPNLDALAADGMVLTDAHVSGSVCSPSRAGILTGRYQQRFGHENNSPPAGFGMAPDEVTIADVMKSQGYKTAVFGKWHVGSEDKLHHPNVRGFDEFYGLLSGHRSYFPSKKYDQPGSQTAIQHNGQFVTFDGYLTYVLGDKTIDFIEQNKADPFFIFLSYTAVHTPMQATKEDLARFKAHPRQTLAAMNWAMDKSIGQVIDKLKAEGLYDNTMIVFLSDNGGPTASNRSSNAPLKASKGYEFEGGHRVPFVIKYDDSLPKGQKYHGLVSSLDLFPTFMAVAGLSKSPGKPLDGVNLVPYLTGQITAEPHEALFWRIGPWGAARLGEYKLINAKGVDTALYDLAADIGEHKNIKSVLPEQYQQAMQQYLAWENQLMEPLWPGSNKWINFKKFMYQDFIDDKEPRFKSMGQFNRYLRQKEK